MTSSFLLYGSYGYTGALIADLAAKRGMQPILAGRNLECLKIQAEALGLQYRHVLLDSPRALEAAVREVPLVLNCAGPFSHTYRPVVEACLRTGRHYLDITGEIEVFEGLAALNAKARDVGVVLLPGVGLDVVPTDCLATYLKGRLPQATQLTLAVGGMGGGFSHGTLLTMLEGFGNPGLVRKDGKLIPVPLPGKTRSFDFGYGLRTALNIPWGDISTAYYSTGIPNIETYMVFPKSMLRMVRIRPIFRMVRTTFMQGLMRRVVMRLPAGPSEEARLHGRSLFYGEVSDEWGNRAVTRLEAMDGHTLTAQTSLAAVERVLRGDFKPGFQTPALAYGPDFILEFEGTVRNDVLTPGEIQRS